MRISPRVQLPSLVNSGTIPVDAFAVRREWQKLPEGGAGVHQPQRAATAGPKCSVGKAEVNADGRAREVTAIQLAFGHRMDALFTRGNNSCAATFP